MTLTLKEIQYKFCIGWFGIPGGPASRNTKVHIIQYRDPSVRGSRGKIICGSKVGPDQQLQWCAPGYGFESSALKLECQRCCKIASKFWIPWHKKQISDVRKKTIAWHKKQIQQLTTYTKGKNRGNYDFRS